MRPQFLFLVFLFSPFEGSLFYFEILSLIRNAWISRLRQMRSRQSNRCLRTPRGPLDVLQLNYNRSFVSMQIWLFFFFSSSHTRVAPCPRDNAALLVESLKENPRSLYHLHLDKKSGYLKHPRFRGATGRMRVLRRRQTRRRQRAPGTCCSRSLHPHSSWRTSQSFLRQLSRVVVSEIGQ